MLVGFVLALGWNIQVPRTFNSRTTGFISFCCCTEEAVTNANGKQNTIIADNKPICYDDFKPDATVMEELFENLLDHHSNFVYPEKKKKTSKKTVLEKNMNRKCLAKKLFSSKKKNPKK